MAAGIKSKFSGIGTKTIGSTGTSTEWNGIITELELINNNGIVDIGDGTVVTGNALDSEKPVVIGAEAKEEAAIGASAFGNGGRTLVGAKSKGGDWKATALGWNAWAMGLSSTAIGHAACVDAGGTHGVALGRGAWAPANTTENGIGGITSLGSTSNKDVYFANSFGHYIESISENGSANGSVLDPTTDEIRLHGRDAKDFRPTPLDVNKSAGHISICSGRATGTGTGGEVRIQTAPAAGGVGSNTKVPLVDAAKFDSAPTSGNDTRFLLLDLTDGTLKRVSFGADDSAGTGFKVLKVAN
jgi:hypothetical protein